MQNDLVPLSRGNRSTGRPLFPGPVAGVFKYPRSRGFSVLPSSQIISIKEARKLLGKKMSDRLTDAQVEEMITQLDFLAELFIKSNKKKEVENGKD